MRLWDTGSTISSYSSPSPVRMVVAQTGQETSSTPSSPSPPRRVRERSGQEPDWSWVDCGRQGSQGTGTCPQPAGRS